MNKLSKKISLAASVFGCVALFGCGGSDSNNAASATDSGVDTDVDAVNLCGSYTTYEDGLGNTYCIDMTTGSVIYSVMADGSIVYATGGDSSETLVESSDSTDPTEMSSSDASFVGTSSASIASNAVCGEMSNPTSIVGSLYFYSDALGSYYYNISDASCTKVYLVVASSSSTSEAVSSATLTTSSTSNSWTVSSSSVTATSSATVVVTSSNSIASTGSSPVVSFSTSGASVENNNNCVSIEGSVVTVLCAGNYYFSGSSDNGQVIVAAPTTDKVYLYLNGLTLTSRDAPIYAQSSDKTFIVVVNGTTNTLTDGSSRSTVYNYTKDGEAKTDTTGAVIYAKDDLTIKGSGALKVTGNYNNGIQTSKDLKVKYDDEFGGAPTITVTAKNNAFKGKNSVEIDGGDLNFTATSGDGIKSDEDDATEIAEGKGRVQITGGTITVNAGDDGIQASNYVLIDDSVSVPKLTVKATGKGIVAENRVYVNAGEIDISSGDDGVHSNMNIYFNGGYTTIAAPGNDGVHADSTLMINDGTIYVTNSYEGLEAWYIKAYGGITDVYATDDAWNAAGGNDGSGNTSQGGQSNWGGPGGMGGMGGMGGGSNSSGFLTIAGGVHHAKTGSGDTDGIDSNGELTISGGVVIVECQISGGQGGSFDSDGTATLSSKTILGFSTGSSEAGTNYSVTFSTANYYGTSYVAFKPSISGRYMVATTGQPSQVNSISGYSKNVTFPSGSTVYYNE